MDLYIRLWPAWLLLAVLAINLVVALFRALDGAKAEKSVSNMTAASTAVLLALASVANVALCLARTISVP